MKVWGKENADRKKKSLRVVVLFLNFDVVFFQHLGVSYGIRGKSWKTDIDVVGRFNLNAAPNDFPKLFWLSNHSES